MTTIRVAVVGLPGAGKTEFMRRLDTGDFGKGKSQETITLHWCTDNGRNLTFVLTSATAQPDTLFSATAAFPDGAAADGKIILIDPTSSVVASGLPMGTETLPTAVCTTKSDLRDSDERRAYAVLDKYRATGVALYNLSAKSLYNSDKPLLHIARQVLGDQTLQWGF